MGGSKKKIKPGYPDKLKEILGGQPRFVLTEEELSGKYRFVSGSLQTEDSGKQSVVIRCAWPGCKDTRRVLTSDLHIAKHCKAHALEHSRSEARRRRAEWRKRQKQYRAIRREKGDPDPF